MRINKYIASSGLCSRRKAEEYIEKGLVTINGEIAVLSSTVNQKDVVKLNGKTIAGLKPYQICELGISRTYQVINLFKKMSVIDNVLVGMHTRIDTNVLENIFHSKKMKDIENKSYKKAYELLKLANLENEANNISGNLAYGQQRLLEIIRAIASNPKLLLLDEPAAGMNETEKNSLNSLIRKIVKMGISVLIVEHDMQLIMDIADKIYVIDSGKNLAYGKPSEIVKNEDVIKAYLGDEG